MKNSILIACILIVNLSFSQTDKVRDNNSNSIFKTKIEENNNKAFIPEFNLLEESNAFDILKPINNSEGKFSIYKNGFKEFKIQESEDSKNKEESSLKSLSTINKDDFIKNVVTKLLVEKKLINETEVYGDKNLDLYKSYVSEKNLLIVGFSITENLKIQIGNSIYPYINKKLKTEIEKTLNTSLNLIAINF
jgi:hypothetical protein